MDKKAKKILFQTYWTSKGWKMGEDGYEEEVVEKYFGKYLK